MKRLFEMTRQEILTKGKNEDPAKFARRLNYVNSIKPMSIAKDLFIKTGTLTVPISVGDYTVTIHVSKIMKLIRKELDKANRILPDRSIVYAALRQAVDQCELQVNCTCPDFCLVGETKIKLLNGEVVPVSEMKDKFDSGEQLWVYSVDKLGEFVPGKVLSVWVSGYRTDLLKVTLDNDEEIITTPNHLYLKRNGEYIAAEELRVGDSLMPLYFKYYKGYEQVKSNVNLKAWRSTYKLVAEHLLKEDKIAAKKRSGEEEIAIHHVDFNKNNNTPENLKLMGKLEHWFYHSSLVKDKWKDEAYRTRILKNIISTNEKRWKGPNSEQNRINLSKFKKDWWDNLTEEQYKIYCGELRVRSNSEECIKHHSKIKKEWWDSLPESRKNEIFTRLANLRRNTYANLSDERKIERAAKLKEKRENWYNSITKEERKSIIGRPGVKNSIGQNEKIGDGQKNYWINLTEEERKERIKKQLRTPEQHKKQVYTRYTRVLNTIIENNEELTEENYYKFKGASDPRINKRFSDFNSMINELGFSNYNHKVKKIEVINLKKKVPVYDIMVEGQENFLVDAGVILHNCYRHAYWATKNNYKYGDPERRPSNITNPNNTGAVCKHTTAALVRPSQWLKYVSGWISTVVRAYLQNKLGINAEDTGDLVDPEDAEDVKDEIESIQDLKSEKEEFEDSDVEVPAEDMETEEETEEAPEKEEETSEEEK